MTFRITEIYAFTTIGDDDEEGIIGAQLGDTMMPLISADATRLAHLMPLAETIARRDNLKVKLSKFTLREEVKTIDGRH